MGGIGSVGEDAALELYRRRGYRLVAKNWRCRLGEVDLIVARDRTLVFCEVKTRRGSRFGGPFDAVTETKRRKLRSLAELFMLEHRAPAHDVRFDVASVSVGPGGPSVHLFEDAF